MQQQQSPTTMFSELRQESSVSDEAAAVVAEPSSRRTKNTNLLANIGRYLPILILSAFVVLLFVQLQAVSLRVASEQQQINDLKDQFASSNQEIEQQVSQQKDFTIINIAGTFTLLSSLVTMFHMTAHLRQMNQPLIQRKVLAILWMSPIYAVTSFLSLILPSGEPYLSIVKDFYEAYVIYQFLSFLIAVLGNGDRDTAVKALARHTENLKAPYRCLHCLFHPPPEESNTAFASSVLMECQVLTMQFVFFRPLTAILMFVLESTTTSPDGWNYFYSAQFVVVMIENISVFLAFSGLLKFYHAVRGDLAWCQPFAKFLTIKGVVFLTFWQGLAISIIFHASSDNDNADDDESDGYSAKSIQQILICMEMLFFGSAHWCVFPVEEWDPSYKARFYEGPVFAFNDFASDVGFIVNSGKRSRQARRDKKNEESQGDRSALDGTNNSTTTSSFGSMDETDNTGEDFQCISSFKHEDNAIV